MEDATGRTGGVPAMAHDLRRIRRERPVWMSPLIMVRMLLLASLLCWAAGRRCAAEDAAHAAPAFPTLDALSALKADPHLRVPAAQQRLAVGILDLDAPSSQAWLGAAVAEAVYTKLLDVPGLQLVERQRLREMLGQGTPMEPRKLGCAVLVTGTIQHSGVWPAGRLRVALKLIAAENGLVLGGGSVILEEDAAELFRLEDELARRMGQALSRPLSGAELARRNGLTLSSEEQFGLALMKMAAAAATDKVQARTLAQEAAEHFRQAQKRNGAFFPAAHAGETRARELLAQMQDDPQKMGEIRSQTVALFRADVAQAAPALYGLGRALQANGDFAGALAAYRDYRTWMAQQDRVLLWDYPVNKAFSTDYYSGFDRALRCCALRREVFYYDGVAVLPCAGGNLVGVDVATGKERWRQQLEGAQQDSSHVRTLLWARAHFYVVDDEGRLLKIEFASGRICARGTLDFHRHKYARGFRLQLGLTDGATPRLFVRQFGNYGIPPDSFRYDEMAAYDTETLRPLWSRKGRDLAQNQVWLLGGRIILQRMDDDERMQLDPETGQEVASTLHKDVLKALLFDHDDATGWFSDAAGGGWLVTGTYRRGDLAKILHVSRLDAQPETEDGIAGVLMAREASPSCKLYPAALAVPERNRVLYADPDTGQTRSMYLDAHWMRQLSDSSDRALLYNSALGGNRFVRFTDLSRLEVFQIDPSWELLWRYHTTRYVLRPPVVLPDSLLLESFTYDRTKCDLLRVNVPQGSPGAQEAQALTREGECLQQLERTQEALKAYEDALQVNAMSLDAAFGAAQIHLKQGRPLQAWQQGRYFLQNADEADPRREQLWRELARACGVVSRRDWLSWPGMRYERAGNRLLAVDNKAIRCGVIGAAAGQETVLTRATGEGHAILSVADGQATIFCGEYKTGHAGYAMRLRLEDLSQTARRELPGLRRVKVAFWDTWQEMREQMDRRPHLFQDQNRPEHFVLLDPLTLQTVGDFRLEEPLRPWLADLHKNDVNEPQSIEFCYEVPVTCIVADGVVVLAGYAEDRLHPHYRLAAWSLSERRLLWQFRLEVSPKVARSLESVIHGMRVMLVPLGSRFLFGAKGEGRWLTFDTGSGAPSGAFSNDESWPHRAPYLFPPQMLLNPRTWVETEALQAACPWKLARGTPVLWKDGPVLLENRNYGTALAVAQLPGWRPLLEQEDAPFVNGALVAPPYTFAGIRISSGQTDFVVLRNDVPFYGRYDGWLAPDPQRLGVKTAAQLPPLLVERADYQPQYPVPVPQAAQAADDKARPQATDVR